MKAAITRFTLAASERRASQDACEGLLLPDAVIAVIADGAGQADGALEAATKTVSSIIANFKARPRTWSIPKALDEFARLINRTLHQESIARFERPELVCTLATIAIEGDRLYGLNVGDSRVYHVRNGAITRLSTDHVEQTQGLEHVLKRAIGIAAELSPQPFESPLAVGDVVLLCTDGVTNVLPDDELASILARRVSARTLVMSARERATEETLDDMAAVIVEITELDPPPPSGLPLEIPETLHAGETHDGFTLVRPFNQNERTWMAQRNGVPAVVKFAPVQARASDAIRNQFLKEIWSLTRLKADFFINAFVPEDSRVLCYGMDYLEAPTLKAHLQSGPLPVDDARALATFLLDACQFLLRFDLVHGDLKPENILALKGGDRLRFKLIDFGSISEVFSVNSRAGTPSYLAPERFHGSPLAERTELFALGVVLHESLTRQFPYGEIEPFQTPEFGAPKKAAQLNPNVPPWMEAIVLRAIAVEPELRYQSYSEMKFDLENPTKVKPWFRAGAPLLERNPALFFKAGFFVMLMVNLYLLFRLLSK